MYEDQTSPDWVITGFRLGSEDFRIVASNKLNKGELEQIMKGSYGMGIADPWFGWSLKLEMREFVMATGTSYAEAFSRLTANWSPEEPKELTR